MFVEINKSKQFLSVERIESLTIEPPPHFYSVRMFSGDKWFISNETRDEILQLLQLDS